MLAWFNSLKVLNKILGALLCSWQLLAKLFTCIIIQSAVAQIKTQMSQSSQLIKFKNYSSLHLMFKKPHLTQSDNEKSGQLIKFSIAASHVLDHWAGWQNLNREGMLAWFNSLKVLNKILVALLCSWQSLAKLFTCITIQSVAAQIKTQMSQSSQLIKFRNYSSLYLMFKKPHFTQSDYEKSGQPIKFSIATPHVLGHWAGWQNLNREGMLAWFNSLKVLNKIFVALFCSWQSLAKLFTCIIIQSAVVQIKTQMSQSSQLLKI